MRNCRGFTLVETLVTAGVLLSGLVAVAAMFSYSLGANYTSRQRTTAAILLYEKMEEFKFTPLTDDLWAEDGFDYVTIGNDAYKRVWYVSGNLPRAVTVIVFVERSGVNRRRMELVRAATTAAGSF